MANVGRPKVDTEAVTVRVSRSLLERLDDRRRQEKDLPTRPEMVRRILEAALPPEE